MSTKLIRRALIASGLFIGAAVAFSPTAFADTVDIGGTVTSTLAITTTAVTGVDTDLDLGGNDTTPTAHIVQVADLGITTNNEQGYTLTVSSGNLTKTGGTSIAYQVTTVADGASAPVAGGFTVASGTDYTVSTTAAGAVAKDLYIKYTPAQLQDPGDYIAQITLNVADR
ncbi:MAG: hypothetical protein HWQ43_29440 [Nostoc sp. JL31]|uniref:hypothetical protein n=1 Tax=Nostoc sp. JL31 TaxID=2815395 RepID=UPI0025E383C5|nr:hypothetical protein [Nostoc sp. JL31]MBN3893072.1 hypothetical protein [Nostoc sp. JL31]